MTIEDLIHSKSVKSDVEKSTHAFQQASSKVANILEELATLLNKFRSEEYYLR
jgi:hypothetical protein